MTLILVRHGESEGNTRGIITGSLDLDLTTAGRQQAMRVGARLASERVAAVYASSRIRAIRTAEEIGLHHGLVPRPLAGLDEYNYGAAEGLTWADFRERYPRPEADGGWSRVPGEEGRDRFRRRVADTIDLLGDRHRDETAVVACHGGTILHVLGHILGLGSEETPPVTIGNCSITRLDQRNGRSVILTLNDRCHLGGDAP